MASQPISTQSLSNSWNIDNSEGFRDRGSYYEVTVPYTTPADEKLLAYYRLWVPNHVDSLRGLIVKQHGCGDPAKVTGLDHANDLQWQALASKHQFALLGTKLPTVYPMCTDESITDRVAEDMLLRALRTLAEKSYHPELDKVPWVLWGHSGGADWAMQILHHYPERVIAVVNMRCGGIRFTSGKSEILDLNPKSVPVMLSVPVLWAIGDKDPYVDECITLPKQIFAKFRKAGAIWTLAVEANTAHEAGDTRFLAIPYLDAILTVRLTNGATSLRPFKESQGWFGNIETRQIVPIAQYKDNPLEATWLPNEETARKWQQYSTANPWNQLRNNFCRVGGKLLIFKLIQYSVEACHTSKVLPAQKPSAPIDVRVTRLGATEAVLTWNFSPDLENGLPSFRIYRDHSLIQTLQEQGHNFGDAPEFPHVALEFHDKEVKKNAVYTVLAFNALGESISQSAQLTEK